VVVTIRYAQLIEGWLGLDGKSAANILSNIYIYVYFAGLWGRGGKVREGGTRSKEKNSMSTEWKVESGMEERRTKRRPKQRRSQSKSSNRP
jgi:hypothetical protein